MKHDHNLGCQDILNNLNAYIDGELDAGMCDQVEAHINACPECQIVVNTLKKTIQLFQVDGQDTTLPSEPAGDCSPAWIWMIMSSPSDPEPLPPTQETNQIDRTLACSLTPNVSLRPGMLCPRCGKGRVDYDGLLNLVCPKCGLTEAGACT